MKNFSGTFVLALFATLLVAGVTFTTFIARAQSTPTYNVDERQARALEDIAESLREMKKCGCK